VRNDVAAAHAEYRDPLHSGFDITVALPPGAPELVLRARCGSAHVELVRQRLSLASDALQGSIETPGREGVVTGAVRISGWIFHPRRRIAHLAIEIDGRLHDCVHAMPREDVAAAFPARPTALASGFETLVTLAPGRYTATLHATLDGGHVVRFTLRESLAVRAEPLTVRVARALRHRGERAVYVIRRAREWMSRHGGLPAPRHWPRLARKSLALLRSAPAVAKPALPGAFTVPPTVDRYDAWLALNRWSDARRDALRRRLADTAALPTLSVVMPVYRPPRVWLDRAVESLREQVHADWQLCIADDASGDSDLAAHLGALGRTDPRIRVTFRERNGNISLATNSAAALATGEFLVFLDQDDELAPDALGEIALALAKQPDADLLYSDDDKIDANGRRYAPQFKPDFSPELLLSNMYMGHALVVRRSLFEALGGFREGFEGSQDFDFALRATERARAVVHIPLVLYHWRALAGSTATSGAAKPASFDAGERAVSEALARRGSRGKAARPPWAIASGIGLWWHDFPDDGPKVALLIPTKNQRDVLARCIDSLARTTYRDYEVVVIDNDSDDAATIAYLASLPHRVLRIGNPGPRFSFAHINNRAAEAVDADYVLFLNNDTEVREPRWLSRMMGFAQLPGVGAVGARLLYPDGRVQHAGVLHGYYDGLPGPAFKLLPQNDYGYLSHAMTPRNYGAVTAACMLTARKLFLDSGGFDEKRFAVAFNDVDYGFRLEARGLRCVYVPGAELTHYEGHTRGFVDDPREPAAYRAQYGRRYERYYNPNLSLADERFAIEPRRAFVAPPLEPARALMCAFNLNWEGAPYSQFEMTAELKRRGVLDPIVYAPQDGPLRAAYERAGIAVHVAPHPLAGVATDDAYDEAVDAFAGWIRDQRVRVVYGNTLQTFYAIDAAHRIGVASVWNPRESEPWQDYYRQFPDAVAARALRCYEYPYRIVFVAHATAHGSAALDTRHNFTVVHNGLDRRRIASAAAGIDRDRTRRDLGAAPDDVVVLLLGTVCERKGQLDLARALAVLPDAVARRVRTFFVGDRPSAYSRSLAAALDALPAERRARVEVVPETEDVARHFIAADVFACTSRVESYPRVILEAMAYGLPIVTTPVFGIREQVREGVNGLFYEPGDVAALAVALERLAVDAQLRSRLASNAVPALDALTDFDEMVEHYARIFVEAAAP
jgi:GT2 family glycosyltransferase/glycosyltransferase involved in cell wall biosynthesis